MFNLEQIVLRLSEAVHNTNWFYMSQKIICKIINFCPWISYPPQKLLVLIHKYSSTPSYDSSASKIFLSQSTCFYIVCVYGCLWISDSSIVLLFCIKLRGGKPKLYRFMLIVWITLYNMYFNVFSINLKIKFFFYKFHAHHNHVAYEIVGLSSCQTRSPVYYMYICKL